MQYKYMQENDAIHLFRKVFYNNVYHGLQSKCLFWIFPWTHTPLCLNMIWYKKNTNILTFWLKHYIHCSNITCKTPTPPIGTLKCLYKHAKSTVLTFVKWIIVNCLMKLTIITCVFNALLQLKYIYFGVHDNIIITISEYLIHNLHLNQQIGK